MDPLGAVIAMSYDSQLNRLTSFTDPRGNTTNYGYDGDGNLGSTCLRTQLPARSGLNSVEMA